MSSILGLPDEGRDALMSAALDPPQRALDSWRRWERSGADARTDPVASRWLPLIGHNLRDAPLDPAARALFVEARRNAWASNLALLNAARPALESLAAAGIRTMLLKGAVLATPPYFEPGLRPIGDVDVLVEPVNARAATRILEESGWLAWRRHGDRDLLLAHGLDLRKPPHGALDLHWYLLAECCWAGADQGVWQRAQPMTFSDVDDGRSGAGRSAASHLRARSPVESRPFRALGRRRRSNHSDRRRAARLGCRRERSGGAAARPADGARTASGSRARARRRAAGGDRCAGAAAGVMARSPRVPLQGPARAERGRPVRDLDRVASKRGCRPEQMGSSRRRGRASWQRRLASRPRRRS